jgi:uncharacterized protein YecT (DUF1311 family)
MRRLLILALLLTPTLALPQQPTDQQRFAALARLNESAPPEQRIAWNALIVAFTAFRDDHVATESCKPAEPCAAARLSEQTRANQVFLDFAEHGPQPGLRMSAPIGEQMIVKSDADLNTAYEQALAALPESCPSDTPRCVSQATFRNTQREWIRYRDAWQTYGKLRWPDSLPAIWLSNLIEQRTAQIKAFFTAEVPGP